MDSRQDARPAPTVRVHSDRQPAPALVVLDESSILKNYAGVFRNRIIDAFRNTPYRLSCTATPAHNDYMELGNQAEFVGAMMRPEMLSMFFVHDGGETQKWRLKGHAVEPFWRWVGEWAVALRSPEDLGYPKDGFDLPPVRIHEHVIDVPHQAAGLLFDCEPKGLLERRQARAASLHDLVDFAADLVNGDAELWLLWCDLNAESSRLTDMIPDAAEVRGSDSLEGRVPDPFHHVRDKDDQDGCTQPEGGKRKAIDH